MNAPVLLHHPHRMLADLERDLVRPLHETP